MRNSEDSYRAAFMVCPERTLIVDAESGTVLDANASALGFLGGSGEVVGSHISVLVDELQLNELLANAGEGGRKGRLVLKGASDSIETDLTAVPFSFGGKPAFQLIFADQEDGQRVSSANRTKTTQIDTTRVGRLLIFHSGFVMASAIKDLLAGQDVERTFFTYPDQLKEGADKLNDADFLVFAVPRITDLEVAEIKSLCNKCRTPPVLVMCLGAGNSNIISLVQNGVRGIITSEGEFHLLSAAINAIMNNELWCPRSLLLQVFENLRALPDGSKAKGIGNPLTERETEILKLIVAGCKNKEIAEKLSISYSTVINHTNNIYRKLEVNNRAGAIRYALDHSLV